MELTTLCFALYPYTILPMIKGKWHSVSQICKIFCCPSAGSNSTREALHATEQGFAVGMHAALHINPYYGKTSMDGLARHFKAVLQEGPTMIYNVPGRTGQDIPDNVVHQLSDSPNFLGVKECTGTARIKVHCRLNEGSFSFCFGSSA